MSPRGEPIGLPLEHGAVVTVGTFDGVHRGHQDVLATLVRRAAEQSLPSVVVTFDPHPLEVVNPAAAPPLLTLTNENEYRLEFLARVVFADFRWTDDDLNLRGADSDRGDIYVRYGPPDTEMGIQGNATFQNATLTSGVLLLIRL